MEGRRRPALEDGYHADMPKVFYKGTKRKTVDYHYLLCLADAERIFATGKLKVLPHGLGDVKYKKIFETHALPTADLAALTYEREGEGAILPIQDRKRKRSPAAKRCVKAKAKAKGADSDESAESQSSTPRSENPQPLEHPPPPPASLVAFGAASGHKAKRVGEREMWHENWITKKKRKGIWIGYQVVCFCHSRNMGTSEKCSRTRSFPHEVSVLDRGSTEFQVAKDGLVRSLKFWLATSNDYKTKAKHMQAVDSEPDMPEAELEVMGQVNCTQVHLRREDGDDPAWDDSESEDRVSDSSKDSSSDSSSSSSSSTSS